MCGQDHLVELWQLSLLVQDNEALKVHLTSVLVLQLDLLSHNIFVRARDDCDQEVEKNDQDQVLVDKPEGPDSENHHLSLPNVVIRNKVFPERIGWCGNISNRVPVGLKNVNKICSDFWIVTIIKDYSRDLVELAEVEHPC